MRKSLHKLEENDLDQVTGGVFLINNKTAGGSFRRNDLMVKPGTQPREDHLVHEMGNKHLANRVGGANQGQTNNPAPNLLMSGGMNGELV
jgi:hypothetical protein